MLNELSKIMHKIKEIIFQLSAILILLSSIGYASFPQVAPWVMAFSVATFCVGVALNPYPGKSIRGKRLFGFRIFACMLMVVATYLMFRHRNEWALAMIAGAIFLLYSSIVISKELKKEQESEN